MKKIIIIIFIAFIISFCSPGKEPKKIVPDCDCYSWVKSVHTTLGVPCDADTSDDYIILRPQYVLSYNKNRNVANWVAWELNADWFGTISRHTGSFITDTSLPEGYYRVKHSDYTLSGYDRGHMVMSEERTKTEEDNMSTFILTNVIPQTPDLNRGVWLNFENYCNRLCLESNKELFIYAGGIFHTNTTIGKGVAVPDSCFKIIVILERGQGLKDVTVNTPVIAVVMPNISGVRSDTWDMYKTTEKRIEASTGYNFLSAVPETIQNVIDKR
jgi:endonuclease G